MMQIVLSEQREADGGVVTKMVQGNEELIHAELFLEDKAVVRDGVVYIKGRMLDALADILLGTQLYNLNHGQKALRLHIQADIGDTATDETTAGDGFGTGRYPPEIVRQILDRSRKVGHEIEIRNMTQGEEHNYMGEGNYEVDCISFEEYFKQNKKPTHSKQARKDALEFAHPVDAGIIRILDTPIVNNAFSSLVDLSVDANYGLVLSTGIRVDEKDPQLSKVLNHCARVLEIAVPYTVISSSISGINAAAIGTDEFSFIAVGSLMKAVLDQDEMEFVLGHECGHIALGHVLYHTVVNMMKNFSELLPVIGPTIYQAISWPLKAWSRRSEISADRAGLLCCQSEEVALKTLLKLEAGFMNTDEIDVEDYIKDTTQNLERVQLGRMRELLTDHPILAKRMEALKLFANSEKYYRISGLTPQKGQKLLDDEQLERATEAIVKVLP